jgi:hypothetical protein
MVFTEKETQKYNGVSKQDLIDFDNREIVYNSTDSSCLGSENAVLTLENERIFHEGMKGFFNRLNNKFKCNRIKNYPKELQCSMFYKWVYKFLIDNQETNKGVRYIYEKTPFNELKEASIILFNQEKV